MTALAMAAPGFEVKKLHQRFLTILPRIKTHSRIYFRDIGCRDQRADCIAEAVALAWKWFVRLAQRGKDATRFPSVLATFAAKAVRSGRRVTGQERSKDVLSPTAQRRHNFTVSKLPDYSPLGANPLIEALHDNTRTPPPDAERDQRDVGKNHLGNRERRADRRIHGPPSASGRRSE